MSSSHIPVFLRKLVVRRAEHFEWSDVRIRGKTPTGRATVEMLSMNRTLIIAIRKEEILAGRDL